ncbi:hypothetical protein BD309DRAFT_974137 [Dichomitus squalens]|uniref:Uncharacterized protein n=1 Tax=Dichomitus squalens TaxID=114155 RepID=A0A4Q9PZ81_9APHY|nr:hypothetical protein BD309DRAFT_974137 [Dichomitus squalens]TBU59654.1 hypothetical protein BD310DRAFT_924726 [Dichomitus squalens]
MVATVAKGGESGVTGLLACRLVSISEMNRHIRGGQSARFWGDSGTILEADSRRDLVLRIAEAPPEELLPSRIAILLSVILPPPKSSPE